MTAPSDPLRHERPAAPLAGDARLARAALVLGACQCATLAGIEDSRAALVGTIVGICVQATALLNISARLRSAARRCGQFLITLSLLLTVAAWIPTTSVITLALAALATGHLALIAAQARAITAARGVQEGATETAWWILALLSAALLCLRFPHGTDASSSIRWSKGLVFDRQLRQRMLPGARTRSVYYTNLNGYLADTAPLMFEWILDNHDPGRSVANLFFSAAHPTTLDVRIFAAGPGDAYQLQINPRTEIPIVAGEPYRLRLRAKATAARDIGVAISRARAPWSNLGLYTMMHLDTTWHSLDTTLTLTESDPRARLHFDVGGSPHSVTISDIELVHVATGRVVRPRAEREYGVAYDMNRYGCRGPEFAPRRASSSGARLLVLGDSYAFGTGVRQDDTFASRLAAPDVRTVMNCSAPGWSTREERRFYELHGAALDPDVVLLVVSDNDDAIAVDEGPANPSRSLTTRTQLTRDDGAAFARELVRLAQRVRRDGRQFAVVLFALRPTARWVALRSAADRVAAQEGVPVLWLGDVMRTYRSDALLVDPPFDLHPSHQAHRIAADAIAPFLAASVGQASAVTGPDGARK